MTKDEWKSLTDSLSGALSSGSALPSVTQINRGKSSQSDIEKIAQTEASVQRSAYDQELLNQRPSKQSSSGSQSSGGGGSVAGDVLKTVGLVTGVGPIVTGLLKLFGGGGSDTPPPALTPYQMPARLSVEAGISGDRSLSEVSYAQGGIARSAAPAAAPSASNVSGSPSGASIQIQVNAMDSRSFMDHSDDIAAAVRSAMLRSNSVNDVISEL